MPAGETDLCYWDLSAPARPFDLRLAAVRPELSRTPATGEPAKRLRVGQDYTLACWVRLAPSSAAQGACGGAGIHHSASPGGSIVIAPAPITVRSLGRALEAGACKRVHASQEGAAGRMPRIAIAAARDQRRRLAFARAPEPCLLGCVCV